LRNDKVGLASNCPEGITMEKARTIKLCFRRRDGRPDWTTVEHCTLGEARDLVLSTLQSADGRYTEADICIESVYTETIPRAVVEAELVSVTDSPEHGHLR
jgi:hypothetical protein